MASFQVRILSMLCNQCNQLFYGSIDKWAMALSLSWVASNAIVIAHGKTHHTDNSGNSITNIDTIVIATVFIVC